MRISDFIHVFLAFNVLISNHFLKNPVISLLACIL